MPQWPADKVSRRPIGELIPYARNARTHSDAQVAQIAASMKEWGWTNPVLIGEDGVIIAGHGRVMAARQLGFTEVPVMVADGWSEAQKRAYVLADNQLAMNAGWDIEMLGNELKGLAEWDFDLSLLGFENLDALLADKIACEKSGRECRAVEITPAYVDVAVIRWQEFTGEKAKLEATGEEFDTLRGERNAKVAEAA
jgi:hypothetical protein